MSSLSNSVRMKNSRKSGMLARFKDGRLPKMRLVPVQMDLLVFGALRVCSPRSRDDNGLIYVAQVKSTIPSRRYTTRTSLLRNTSRHRKSKPLRLSPQPTRTETLRPPPLPHSNTNHPPIRASKPPPTIPPLPPHSSSPSPLCSTKPSLTWSVNSR